MNILIVDDEAGLRAGLMKILKRRGFDPKDVGSVKGALKILDEESFDCLLLDLRIQDEDGLQVLKYVRDNDLDTSVIIMTGFGDIRNAVTCMQQGADNYITKPINNDLLFSILQREEENRSTRSSRKALQMQIDELENKKGSLLGSANREMRKIHQIIEKVKDTPVPVLITGETGTGKEITARELHNKGNRAKEPFVSLNCASLNENLLESELFGHVKGAYTGAHKDKPGRFELAGRGTLFLDELGDMSLSMQVKLLRILQEGTYEKVGGTRTYQSHCRIVAATNKNLEEMMESGSFRKDLYYRLNLVELKLPPLRERMEDIQGFINLFIEDANSEHGKQIKGIHPSLVEKMSRYNWPGNIRELKNSIDYAVLFSDAQIIEALDMFRIEESPVPVMEISLKKDLKTTMDEIYDRYESELIKNSLHSSLYNIAASARELGISRKTLYAKMKKHGIPIS